MLYFQFSIILLVLTYFPGFSQNGKEWGVSVEPAFSRARFPRGVGVSYAGPPFFSGDLKVKERAVIGTSLNVFVERGSIYKLRPFLKDVSVRTALGLTTFGAFQHFDYDFANSFNNVISVEKRYNYLTLDLQAKYKIPIKEVVTFISLGPHISYVLNSVETVTNLVGGQETQTRINLLKREEHFNYGSVIDLGCRYKQFAFSIFYKSYYKEHVDHQNKRVFLYGLNISYYFKSSRKEGEI